MLPTFARDTIARVRPTLAADGHGNMEPNWSDAATLSISGCSVQPGASTEDQTNRSGVSTLWTVYAPPTSDVTAHDAVDFRGVRYQVNGEPALWSQGFLDHMVIQLSRFEG
jgi:hypothetical protein